MDENRKGSYRSVVRVHRTVLMVHYLVASQFTYESTFYPEFYVASVQLEIAGTTIEKMAEVDKWPLLYACIAF